MGLRVPMCVCVHVRRTRLYLESEARLRLPFRPYRHPLFIVILEYNASPFMHLIQCDHSFVARYFFFFLLLATVDIPAFSIKFPLLLAVNIRSGSEKKNRLHTAHTRTHTRTPHVYRYEENRLVFS